MFQIWWHLIPNYFHRHLIKLADFPINHNTITTPRKLIILSQYCLIPYLYVHVFSCPSWTSDRSAVLTPSNVIGRLFFLHFPSQISSRQIASEKLIWRIQIIINYFLPAITITVKGFTHFIYSVSSFQCYQVLGETK